MYFAFQNSLGQTLYITREHVEKSLAIVVPAVKNTSEFVTIPNVTWANVGGLESVKVELHNRFMVCYEGHAVCYWTLVIRHLFGVQFRYSFSVCHQLC